MREILEKQSKQLERIDKTISNIDSKTDRIVTAVESISDSIELVVGSFDITQLMSQSQDGGVEYTNPSNPNESWNGKGETPSWMKALLEHYHNEEERAPAEVKVEVELTDNVKELTRIIRQSNSSVNELTKSFSSFADREAGKAIPLSNAELFKENVQQFKEFFTSIKEKTSDTQGKFSGKETLASIKESIVSAFSPKQAEKASWVKDQMNLGSTATREELEKQYEERHTALIENARNERLLQRNIGGLTKEEFLSGDSKVALDYKAEQERIGKILHDTDYRYTKPVSTNPVGETINDIRTELNNTNTIDSLSNVTNDTIRTSESDIITASNGSRYIVPPTEFVGPIPKATARQRDKRAPKQKTTRNRKTPVQVSTPQVSTNQVSPVGLEEFMAPLDEPATIIPETVSTNSTNGAFSDEENRIELERSTELYQSTHTRLFETHNELMTEQNKYEVEQIDILKQILEAIQNIKTDSSVGDGLIDTVIDTVFGRDKTPKTPTKVNLEKPNTARTGGLKGIAERVGSTFKSGAKAIAPMAGMATNVLGTAATAINVADEISQGNYGNAALEGIGGVAANFVPGGQAVVMTHEGAKLFADSFGPGGFELIQKLRDEDAISYGFSTTPTVDNWNKIEQLKVEELKTLINTNEFEGKDLEHIKQILVNKQSELIKPSESSIASNSTDNSKAITTVNGEPASIASNSTVNEGNNAEQVQIADNSKAITTNLVKPEYNQADAVYSQSSENVENNRSLITSQPTVQNINAPVTNVTNGGNAPTKTFERKQIRNDDPTLLSFYSGRQKFNA